MKKLLVLMMALVMVLSMTACGGNGADPGDTAAEMTVTVEIDFPDGSAMADVEEANVTLPEGSTIYDVLKSYADANNMEVILDQSGSTDYITSIGGVAQTDNSGWVYEVNDEMVMEPATTCVVNNGDVIDWEVQTW
jgi:predicted small lipoprotein YifL